jgi:hypothetical protein
VVNLPDDVLPEDAPLFVPNEAEASESWYELVAEIQSRSLRELNSEYPMTADVTLDDGKSVRIKLKKRLADRPRIDEPVPATRTIEGVQWQEHLVLPSGPHSGFVPLIDRRPMYFIDHGTAEYTHDAYGIHLFQEDRLTFLGPTDQTVTVHFFDARKSSGTAGNEETITFSPSPHRMLLIPPGVAHAFEHIERVFTVNRPRSMEVPGTDFGSPTSDVVDWPLNDMPRPLFDTGKHEVSEAFYSARVEAQLEAMKETATAETPAVLLVDQPDGTKVRVALRKRVS